MKMSHKRQPIDDANVSFDYRGYIRSIHHAGPHQGPSEMIVFDKADKRDVYGPVSPTIEEIAKAKNIIDDLNDENVG